MANHNSIKTEVIRRLGPTVEAERVSYLLVQYVNYRLTRSEHDELDDWVDKSDDNMLIFEEVTHVIS